jgi:type IV pilus assembly protein PilC
MQMLLSTGVALLEAMRMSAEATSNVVYQEQITLAQEKVQAGKPLSEALKDKKYMMPLVPQMASIGEESGKIDEMLGKAAQVYEDELDEQIATISTMIEPILMVIMAGLIGFIVLAVLMPIYSLVSSVG